ncbi:MAG TPA: hypothetical protein VND90_11615 [Terracidiphilus sp.]|nr:hypothetical protein [Terracidiphilus sp.]
MRKIVLACCLPLLFVILGSNAASQDAKKTPEPAPASTEPTHYYHLDFVVQELDADGKPVNSRSYSTSVTTDTHRQFGSIRASARVPVAVGPYSTGGSNALQNLLYQIEDVGVNIDVHNAHEIGRQLSIDLTASISSVAHSTDVASHQPVLRQNQWKASVLIPIGKPTVVFTSDDLDTKGSMQVVVTAKQIE